MSGKQNKKLRKIAKQLALGLPEKNLEAKAFTRRRIKKSNGEIYIVHNGTSEHIGCERTIYQQLKHK